jgi:magnesium and cobalt transporter
MSRNATSDPTIRGNGNGNGGPAAPSFVQSLRGWLRRLGPRRNGGKSLRDTLEELIKHHGDDAVPVSPDERTMFTNLFKFGELRVDDVMVPRADVVAVEQSTPVSEVVSIMRKAGHSRLPVYRGTLDDIVGMVHVRDLLKFWGSGRPAALTAVVRRQLFVPPSMQVRDLLLQMRASRIHMAIVVDEYGGTDGCVTIEDLIEEIVGEIHDEHDAEELPLLLDRTGGVIEADARASVEDLERRVGFSLLSEDGEEDVETLGGLVFSLAGRVPGRGELITHPTGLQFEIMEADPRRIKRLRIRRIPPPPTHE